jgi:zinc protease
VICTRTLANGLRVVVVPDTAAPVAAVAVVHDTGMRAERPGQAGFAHLFEHLMFQGSRRVPAGAHARLVQAVGGSFNGTTTADRTCYHQVVPPQAVERVLFLEADRMAAPTLDAGALESQRAVIREEVRGKIEQRPFGGFPRAPLSHLLFERYANAHDGFGDLRDLQSATVEEVRAFFDSRYDPRGAVVSVVGDVDADDVLDAVERHFGDLPTRRHPCQHRPAALAEPRLAGDRHGEHVDPRAPLAAVAAGWRVPDPADLDRYLPFVVLAQLLGDPESGRLPAALVRGSGAAVAISAGVDLMGDPFEVLDPTGLVVTAFVREGVAPEAVLRGADEVLARVADGVPDDELSRVRAVFLARSRARLDRPAQRALGVATSLQQRGVAELPWQLPGRLARVGAAQVAAAAAELASTPRAIQIARPARAAAGAAA